MNFKRKRPRRVPRSSPMFNWHRCVGNGKGRFKAKEAQQRRLARDIRRGEVR